MADNSPEPSTRAATPTSGSSVSSRSGTPPTPHEGPRESADDTSKGNVVDIAGHVFTINRELGRGNFGVVFEAASHGNLEPVAAAVKFSKLNKADVNFSAEHQERQLLTECVVLQRLGDKLPCHCLPRVPKYLAHATSPSNVTLAMTKAAGQPLDTWLYGKDESDESAVTTVRASSMDFEGACRVVARLLSQLAPVFSTLQDFAFHRDVSAHNLMIDDAPCALGGSPDFTLIDFGLAVEAPEWLQNWRTQDIGGDPRYWSPAHWLKLFFGPEKLERDHPALARLFRERLDHYSFGIVALELFFGLWGPPSDEISAQAAAWQYFARARDEWQNYRCHALALRQAVVQHAASLPALRHAAVDSGLVAGLLTAHVALCSALREAAAEGQPAGREANAVPFFLAAASLIDPSSKLSWDSVSELGVAQARFSAPRAGSRP